MKTNKILSTPSINKVWENFRKMNGIVLTIPSSSWIESEEGFTNTVYYDGFTADEILEIDLYNDGNLTETQITEYDGYITEFNVEDGKIVAVATTLPTQDISILCRGEIVGEKIVVNGGGSSNISASNVSCLDKDGQTSNVQKELDEQNKNLELAFQLGVDRKSQIINSMQYTGLGLTEESTWEEIIAVLTEYFPDSYYLYNSGDNCKIITGGYVASGTYTAYSENTSDCLYFYSLRLSTNASGNYGYLRTKNKVEIKSEHTALKCHVKSASQLYGQLWFYIGTSATSRTKEVKILAYDTAAIKNKEFTIDISDLKGNYYVGLAIASGGANGEHATVNIDKIWIE